MAVNLANRPPRSTFETPWPSVNELLGECHSKSLVVLASETPAVALAVSWQWSNWLTEQRAPTLFLASGRGRTLGETEKMVSAYANRGVLVAFINPPLVVEEAGAPRYQAETEMYRDLIFVARRTNVLLVVLNQVTCLNKRGIVTLTDLPETEAYEYEADQILFVRHIAEAPDIDFTVVKNRFGPMNVTARCGWIVAEHRVVELSQQGAV